MEEVDKKEQLIISVGYSVVVRNIKLLFQKVKNQNLFYYIDNYVTIIT